MELSYDHISKKKRSLGVEELSWSEYFTMFVESLTLNDVFMNTEEENEVVLVTVWCTHKGKQLSLNFELKPFLGGDGTDEKDQVAAFVFSIVDALKESSSSECQKDIPKQSLSSLPISSTQGFLVDTLTVGDLNRYNITQMKTQANFLEQQKADKRKGRSLVNPRVKRRKPQPTKISSNTG
eukprot:TRINITY_DN1660_c0_g1_i3.p1 TRINITY_DN1660_c0_g1~~TRINITY_DN1660_c0_g1_i3.p1  ORF type:complete len:181 (-),score=50.90 TRINITY_DN1660_c0_g1_i3:1141-1683(-)